jgi:hypothetical protein
MSLKNMGWISAGFLIVILFYSCTLNDQVQLFDGKTLEGWKVLGGKLN